MEEAEVQGGRGAPETEGEAVQEEGDPEGAGDEDGAAEEGGGGEGETGGE